MCEIVKEKVLVIAAHPDDEILGCGGTLARHVMNGDLVDVVIFAEGVTSRDDRRDQKGRIESIKQLHDAAYAANKMLGIRSLQIFDFPDNRMDSFDRLDVIKEVERCIKKFEPSIIYTHHVGDVNIDHKIIHESVITACRPLPKFCVKKILFFEVASSTEWQPNISAPFFAPNWFVDISHFLDCKLQALDCYATEMRDFPHSRSSKALKALAEWRGASVGVDAAEAFILGRNII
jgi:LmbE family N-acetylglucosaminyl deacetylase